MDDQFGAPIRSVQDPHRLAGNKIVKRYEGGRDLNLPKAPSRVLVGARFFGTCLEDLDFRGVDLRRTNWRNSRLRGLKFQEVNLEGATFGKARVSCDFSAALMRDCTLRNTRAQGSTFAKTDLREADMYKCDLRGCDLRGSDLRGASLKCADLRGADLTGATMDEDTCLGGVKLNGVIGWGSGAPIDDVVF